MPEQGLPKNPVKSDEVPKEQRLEAPSVTLEAEEFIENSGVISGGRVSLKAFEGGKLQRIQNSAGACLFGAETLSLSAVELENAGKITGSSTCSILVEKTLKNSDLLSGQAITLNAETLHNTATSKINCQSSNIQAERIVQQGEFLVQGKLHMITKRFAHERGSLQAKEWEVIAEEEVVLDAPITAGKVCLTAKDVHITSPLTVGNLKITGNTINITAPIDAEGDIEIFHEGGEWDIPLDKLRAKGKVILHLKEAPKMMPVMNAVGSVEVWLDPQAKNPVQFTGENVASGDIRVFQPLAFTFGSPTSAPTLISKQGVVEIQAPNIYWMNGRIAGGRSVVLRSQGDLQLGIPLQSWVEPQDDFDFRRYPNLRFFKQYGATNTRFGKFGRLDPYSTNLHTCLGPKGRVDTRVGVYRNPCTSWSKPLHYGVGLASQGNIVLEGRNLFWNHLEMVGLADLIVKGVALEDIASKLIIQGNARFEVPTIYCRALTEVRNLTGQSGPLSVSDADAAYRRFYEQQSIITAPAPWFIGQTLEVQDQLVLIGRTIGCSQFKGPTTPRLQTLTAYRTFANYCLYGNGRWWVVNEGVWVEEVRMAKFSVGGKTQTQSPILVIDGIFSALNMKLGGIEQGVIGRQTDLRLPGPKPYQPYLPLSNYTANTLLFEMTEPGAYPTVYRPICPFEFRDALGPILIAGPQGLRPNSQNRRRLYTGFQEKEGYLSGLMDALSRAFLGPGFEDPDKGLKRLRENAEIFAQNDRALVPRDGSVPVPMIVYEEIECIHASMRREKVLVPVLCLPRSFDNPRLRDYAGGLFSLGDMLIQGASRDRSTLTITAHMDAQGEMVFSTFDCISQQRRVVKEWHSLSETTRESRWGGISHKTRSSRTEVERVISQAGNSVTAAEWRIENTNQVHHAGLSAEIGEGGARIEARQYTQEALMEVDKEQRPTLKLGSTRVTREAPKMILQPTHLNAKGGVVIEAESGFVQNLNVNGVKVQDKSGPGWEIRTDQFIIDPIEERLERQRAAQDAEEREMCRKAKRAQNRAIVKTLTVSLATAGVGSLAGVVLSRIAFFAQNALALTAAQGAVAGGVGAALTKENVLKGAVTGAALNVFRAKVGGYLKGRGVDALTRERIVQRASATVSSLMERGNVLRNVGVTLGGQAIGGAALGGGGPLGDAVESAARAALRSHGRTDQMLMGAASSVAASLGAALGQGLVGVVEQGVTNVQHRSAERRSAESGGSGAPQRAEGVGSSLPGGASPSPAPTSAPTRRQASSQRSDQGSLAGGQASSGSPGQRPPARGQAPAGAPGQGPQRNLNQGQPGRGPAPMNGRGGRGGQPPPPPPPPPPGRGAGLGARRGDRAAPVVWHSAPSQGRGVRGGQQGHSGLPIGPLALAVPMIEAASQKSDLNKTNREPFLSVGDRKAQLTRLSDGSNSPQRSSVLGAIGRFSLTALAAIGKKIRKFEREHPKKAAAVKTGVYVSGLMQETYLTAALKAMGAEKDFNDDRALLCKTLEEGQRELADLCRKNGFSREEQAGVATTMGYALLFMKAGKGAKIVNQVKGPHKLPGSSVKEAAKNRQKNISSGIPASALGPSGEPKRIIIKHSTKKTAEDAAVNSSARGHAPEHHPNPVKGEPHFHPSGSNKREHHTYPRKGFPRREKD